MAGGLEIAGLSCAFGDLLAVDNLSLHVPRGELRCVVGPNGAGKSTLLAMIAGDVRPTHGRITWDGIDVTSMRASRRARRGFMISYQTPWLFDQKSVFENVRLAVQSRSRVRLGGSRYPRQVVRDTNEILSATQLLAQAHLRAGTISHGQRAWVEVAMAFARDPDLLLLDEPTAGMAESDVRHIEILLDDLRRDRTVIVIEHDLDFVKRIADRITVLDGGRHVATGSPSEIARDVRVRDAYLSRTGTHDA